MGKALKTVGVIIGGAALIATGVGALAMPALAGTTTLFGVSVGTLNTISSGLVAVGGLLDKPKSQGSAQPDEWTSNPDQPIPFLMGRMGIAGKIVQRDEFGPDNMYQGIVGILSGAGPIRGVTGFAGDKQPVTFGANGIAVSSQWQGEMWMVRRSGAQPDTALTVPAGLKSGGSAFEWSPAAKLSGKACYLQVLGENSKGTAFPAGVPDPVHTAEGIYGYDPRYDDTYPGGAGPCRLGVRSTYRWIEDGGIGGLNWALGLVENGQVVGGIGASLDGIDVPAFIEVANIADANNWKLAAWPDTSEDVSAVLDQLLQAAGAVRARHAGKISCVSRGAPRASVATITARDTAGDIELDTAPSLFNRLNTITPRFMSEAAGWVLTPANPVSFAQYVTDDGGKHSDQIDYRFVSDLKQAAELAAYDILDAREPFSGTIPLKPHMRHLKRGDTFLVSEPGFLMDGVKCIVLSRSYDPKTAQVRIGFRSETDSKHALALGKTTTLPEFPVLTPTDPTEVSRPLPGDWTITPRPPSQGGAQQPGFDLTGFVSNSTATAIIVETGPSATGPWTQAYQGPPTVTNIPIDGLQPGATYFIAIQYQRNQNYSEREVFGPFTAPDLVAGDLSPESPVWTEIELQGVAIDEVTGRLVGVEGITEILQQGVSDLEEVYGDTASAAASAAAAVEAKSDAIQAKADALIAASDASERASEASEERIKAETARGLAESYRNQAADSVTAAGLSAASASENAGLAATARGEAQGFAGAALDYRNQASGFVTDAEAAAAVSTAQKLEAVAARDDAEDHALASAQSASQAFASETAAGQQAATATQERIDAQTARGQAEGFKNQAVQAYQDAQGQASIATTQAGLASGSATLAGDKAQAASESASLASTKADAAGTSAQAAEVSKLQAASSYDAAAQLLYQQFPPTLAPDSRGSYEGYGPTAGPDNWPTPYISFEEAGTITYREFRHKRRIPKLVGKRYRFECWVYTYATNVRFSVHRHDYPNQTGTAGIRYLGQMSAATTGSPNIKPPTETFTLVAGEFEVLLDDQAFLGPYLAAETDNGQPSNGLIHVGGIAITDVTSEKKATTAAEAAIINAASAETFAGHSEDWAEASESQYLLAKGSAGEAKGYSEAAVQAKDGAVIASSSSALSATASDTARDLSEKARDKAFEHRDAASNSAGIAEDKAAEADAFAASASISASLAASTSALRGNLLPNGGMERGLEGISGQNLYVSNDSWGPAVRVAPTGNGTYTVNWAPADIFGGGTYTVSGDALLFAESGSRYFDMIFLDANGGIAGDSGQKPMGPGDYSNDRTRINAMAWTEQAPSNAAKVVVRAVFEGVVNPTAMGARRVKLEFGPGPATAYTADGAVDALSAQLDITAAVAVDAQTRLADVIFEVIAASGGDPFQLLFKTIGSSSIGQMVASALRFGNVIGGQIVETMKLIAGEVFIVGPLYLGPNKEIELNPLSSNPHISIKVGGGRMAFGKLPNDNLIYWFGPSQTVAAMRKNNATEWRDTLGNAYFGGSLAAGQLIARDRTSSLSVSASVDTGRYGSNGGAITVTASLSGGWGKTYYSASNLAAASESGTIVVSLDRAINGGAFSNGVATMSRAYTWSRENQGFEQGQGYLIVENGSYGGAITYTDPQQVAQDRQYRARITNFSPITLAGPPTVQDLSVISVE